MTKAIPTMVVSLTVFTVITGGIFFKEFEETDAEDAIFFSALAFAVVIMLVLNWCHGIKQIISPTPSRQPRSQRYQSVFASGVQQVHHPGRLEPQERQQDGVSSRGGR